MKSKKDRKKKMYIVNEKKWNKYTEWKDTEERKTNVVWLIKTKTDSGLTMDQEKKWDKERDRK